MKILVTGHTGYIGSVLAERLQQAGHEVIGFDSGFYADCLLGNPINYIKSIMNKITDALLYPRDEYILFDKRNHYQQIQLN